MNAVRVIVETQDGVVEYLAHTVNRSKHALTGAARNAWRRFPAAKAVSAQYIVHNCDACQRTHNLPTQRRVYKRVAKRGVA